MHRLALVLSALLTVHAAAPTPPTPARDTLAEIRAEAFDRSQVMDTLFWLTDRHGPRLTGSPGFEEAGDWALSRLAAWGVEDVRKERFAFGPGWSLVRFRAQMTAPRVMPIIGMPKAWTPGTNGEVVADVVRATVETAADAAALKGTLRGRIVLTQPAREVRMLDGRIVLRMSEKDVEEALAGASPSPARAEPDPDRLTSAEVAAFYASEGVVAMIDRGSDNWTPAGGSGLSWRTQRVDGGTIFVGGASRATPPEATVPQITIAVEHYNRMSRLLDHGVPVTMTLDVETRYHPEDPARPNGFNIVGEIPGTDKADEIVLIGAHFDSWHGATGATDNATGTAAMMEVMRIFEALDLRPRRTVRVALWGAEENGLIGSRHYASSRLGTPGAPAPALAAHVAYFNVDNGTGKIRGIWLQENTAAAPMFAEWMAPLRDLGVEILAPRAVTSTDHVPFDRLGVPAFQFIQERYEYNSRTHHSNMDFYDRVQADDLKQIAAVVASVVWQAANAGTALPRKPM